MVTKVERAPAQDLRAIAANTARDLALGLRFAVLRLENFEPGQGKEAARELAEQLSAAARRARELYYLESLTQAVAISEGPLRVRRRSELGFLSGENATDIQKFKSAVSGCYNKLGFALLLECELERARRRKNSLSVALLKLNPPDKGLLQEVAQRARESCRLLDVLGILDSRGIGILLPDTGPEGTQVAIQRLLSTLISDSEPWRGFVADQLQVGHASFPEDGTESRQLFAQADARARGGSLLRNPTPATQTA